MLLTMMSFTVLTVNKSAIFVAALISYTSSELKKNHELLSTSRSVSNSIIGGLGKPITGTVNLLVF